MIDGSLRTVWLIASTPPLVFQTSTSTIAPFLLVKKNALVLGAGLIGGPIAVDLARSGDIAVTIADVSDDALGKAQRLFMRVGTGTDVDMRCFANEITMRELMHEQDIVVSAVPGKYGLSVMQSVLQEGKPMVDISFGEHDPFALCDANARAAKVPVAVDCGVAPGMSHMLVGKASRMLTKIDSVRIDVGGLPLHPKPPHFYQAPFAPASVIDEYMRSAGYMEDGTVRYVDPLAEIQDVTIPTAGTFEAFRSDGLRTLLRTMQGVRSMSEWTLRYPGHLALMKSMRDQGAFTGDRLEETIATLEKEWELGDDPDQTIMRVTVDGWDEKTPMSHSWILKDKKKDGIHSMARTTGLSTAALVARLILDGKLWRPGIIAPEDIGADNQCMEYMMKGMEKRNIHYRYSVGGAAHLPKLTPSTPPTVASPLGTPSLDEISSPGGR
jgi:saccharopine dehydrogenase-like NADP-dependent oxidoreductase